MDTLLDLQDAFTTFVKERVPPSRWKEMTTRRAIENEMDLDEWEELKETFFAKLVDEMKWFIVLNRVEEMVRQNQEIQGEEEADEEEGSQQSEEEDDE